MLFWGKRENDVEGASLTGRVSTLPWWQRSRAIVIALAISAALILNSVSSCAFFNGPPPAYEKQQVTQGDLNLTINATGPLTTTSYSLAYTGTTAKITEIAVQVGQHVSKGQVLARVDPTQLQNQVNKDQAQITADQMALYSAQVASGSTAQTNNQNAIDAQNQLQNAQNAQNIANSLATNSAQTAQTNLDQARTALANARKSANLTRKQAATQRDDTIKTTCTRTVTVTPTRNMGGMDIQMNPLGMGPGGHGGSGGMATPTVKPGPTSIATPMSTSVPTQVPNPVTKTVVDQACVKNANATYNVSVNNADQSIIQAQQKVDTLQLALSQAQLQGAKNQGTATQNIQSAQSNIVKTQATTNQGNASAQNNVFAAQARLQTDQLTLQQDQVNLANATLTAPHDGVITAINGAVGGVPGASSNGSTSTANTVAISPGSTFIQLVDLNSLQVNAGVNESDMANLQIGQPATFTVDAYGDRQFHATVSAISPQGQAASNVVSYPVSLDIDPASTKGATLYPNMTANATITVVQRNNVLQVPAQAINFARQAANPASTAPHLITPQAARDATNQARQMSSDLQNQNPDLAADSPTPAFVIEQSGDQFVAKPVVVGITDGANYEVLDGLQLGETVITGAASGTKTP